ncbi:MAG: OmpH family outer membrane protein [Pyrinomonadaceae bacterium]|nr:OmpH family outer membrane protein [Sphingobacteriaceae bacterium]
MKTLVKVAVVAAGLFFTGSTVQAQQKFGHLHSGNLLEVMPEIKAADANLQTFQKQKQAVAEQMSAEYQKKVTVFEDKRKTLSEANKEALGKELEVLYKEIQGMEQRITEANQKVQQEIQAKQAELYQPIYKKAGDAVNAVAKEKGYAYIFDTSQPGVVYFDGGDDIIALVRAKLGIPPTATAAAVKK